MSALAEKAAIASTDKPAHSLVMMRSCSLARSHRLIHGSIMRPTQCTRRISGHKSNVPMTKIKTHGVLWRTQPDTTAAAAAAAASKHRARAVESGRHVSHPKNSAESGVGRVNNLPSRDSPQFTSRRRFAIQDTRSTDTSFAFSTSAAQHGVMCVLSVLLGKRRKT